MRTAIKKILPKWMHVLWFNFREFIFLTAYPDTKSRFSKIYSNNMWQNPESASGFGSTLIATQEARKGLEALIDTNHVRSILDVPCGDFNWMRSLKFAGNYIGVDIVDKLVEDNQRRYADERHRFIQLDLIKDKLPQADLVLCRECLNHLSLVEVRAAISNLIVTPTKFLIMTHYPDVSKNAEQLASFRYRPLNFTKSPFFLRQPDMLIDESQSESGKCLAVWEVGIAPVVLPTHPSIH